MASAKSSRVGLWLSLFSSFTQNTSKQPEAINMTTELSGALSSFMNLKKLVLAIGTVVAMLGQKVNAQEHLHASLRRPVSALTDLSLNLVPVGIPRKLQEVCDEDLDQLPNLNAADCTDISCTSKDLAIGGARLDFDGCQTCEPGEEVTVKLLLRIINKTGSTRTSFGYTANLVQTFPNGTTLTCIDERCGGPIDPDPTTDDSGIEIPFGNVTFICGNELVLEDILQFWTKAAPRATCDSFNSCSKLSPKCGRPEASIQINTQLTVSVEAKCDRGKKTLSVNSTVRGGTGNYTMYIWTNATGDVVGNEENLQGVPDNTNYTLTVFDSDGCNATDSAGDGLICCFFEATCLDLDSSLGPCKTESDVPFFDDIVEIFNYTGVPCSPLELTNTSLTFPNCSGTTITRNYTLTDKLAVDGSLTCTQNIVLNPRKKPPKIFGVGDPVTAECPDCTGFETNRNLSDCFSPDVTATDQCGENVTPVRSGPVLVESGCGNNITGTWMVTWMAIDRCDPDLNVTAMQTVIIDDTIDPTIEDLIDMTADCPACTGDLLDQCFGEPTARDACDYAAGLSTNVSRDGTDSFDEDCGPSAGTWTRKWIATDACGNSGDNSTSEKNVTIEDNLAPALTCPGVSTISACDGAPAPVNLTATDACQGDIQANDTNCCFEPNIFGSGMFGLKRTFSVTDACGNPATCDQYFLFSDTCPTPTLE